MHWQDGFPENRYLSLLGRPFHEDTWNCWLLCREVYRRLGRQLPNHPYSADLQRRADTAEIARSQFIRIEEPYPWCIVALAHKTGIIHTGVVLPDCKYFIHVREQCGTVVSPLIRWKHLIEGYYAYRSI